MEDFDALKRKSLVKFHKTFYTSDRCTIVVSGKIPADLNAMLDEFFGDLNWSSSTVLAEAPLPNPISDSQRVHTIEKEEPFNLLYALGVYCLISSTRIILECKF